MRTILLNFLMIFAFNAQADCYEKLTKGYQDSAFFTTHSSYVYSNANESLDELMATNAVNKILKDLACDKQVKSSQMECANVLRTTLCRIDTQEGYFLITKDYVDTVNLIFNRWD